MLTALGYVSWAGRGRVVKRGREVADNYHGWALLPSVTWLFHGAGGGIVVLFVTWQVARQQGVVLCVSSHTTDQH